VKDKFQQSKFRYTNEAVGLFVLMAVLIFIAGLIYSGRVREWFNPGEMLRVVLPDEGLSGLAKGSTVEILGTKAGEVRDIVINPSQKMHADVRIDSEMAVFVRSDSKATIRKTFGIAGDAYLEITRGFGEPLDWEFAVITAVSDRKPTDTVGDLIDEMRAKVLPVIDDAQKAIQAFLAVAEELQDPEKGVQLLLANLNSISDRIDRGEGALGRMLTEDKLVRDLEALIAQINTETKRVGPILDDLKNSMQNVAHFSAQINAQSKDIPVITQSLKEVLTSVQMVMKNLSQTTPQLPQVVKNVEDTTDTLPVLILQVQQVMVELERLIKQLQSHWLLGGRSGKHSQPAARISPLEISP
jgi:phospholipid/cholesterol/gamma-HCH transport system substrate-binding protein